MKLYIKFMVSHRCKMAVQRELDRLDLHQTRLDLGLVEIREELSGPQREALKINLKETGLELLDNKKAILIDRVKSVIIEMIHYADQLPKTNYSVYISDKIHYDYTYLSNIFSAEKGITIQHFIVIHKIEKVKELLSYDELNLSEISHKLHYSSVAHLSSQFKRVTGLTPSFYRKMKQKRVSDLEML